MLESDEVLDLLDRLVARSLVGYTSDSQGGRYTLLESVRQYARERLYESGELGPVRLRHALHYLDIAESAAPELYGPDQVDWFDRLEREHDNVRTALDWFQAEAKSGACEEAAGRGLRLAGALSWFWDVRAHWTEGIERCRSLLAMPAEPTTGRARALTALGNICLNKGLLDEAGRAHEEALSIKRILGNRAGVAASMSNLGNVAALSGDYTTARRRYEQAFAEASELGDAILQANSLIGMGYVCFEMEDFAGARERYEQALALVISVSDRCGIAWLENGLAEVATYEGNLQEADSRWRRALRIALEVRHWQTAAAAISTSSLAATARQDWAHAARLAGAASTARDSFGIRLSASDSLRVRSVLDRIRIKLGHDAFEAEWQAGIRMDVEQAAEFALSQQHADPDPAESHQLPV